MVHWREQCAFAGPPPLHFKLQRSVDGCIGLGQRKGRDLDIEMLVALRGHLIGAVHGSERRGERAASGVLKTLTRTEHGLIADDAGAADLLHFAHAIGDHPVTADQLHRVAAFIPDVDAV